MVEVAAVHTVPRGLLEPRTLYYYEIQFISFSTLYLFVYFIKFDEVKRKLFSFSVSFLKLFNTKNGKDPKNNVSLN